MLNIRTNIRCDDRSNLSAFHIRHQQSTLLSESFQQDVITTANAMSNDSMKILYNVARKNLTVMNEDINIFMFEQYARQVEYKCVPMRI